MTELPPKDERFAGIRRDAQRRLEQEDHDRQAIEDHDRQVAQAKRLAAAAARRIEAEAEVFLSRRAPLRLANELKVKDVRAEANYQFRSYLFLGLSILGLTFFVTYGAREIVLASLTVALLLLMSALAGLWAIFLGFEKHRRGMLAAVQIKQLAEAEEEVAQESAIEEARAALQKATSGRAAYRSATSGKLVIRQSSKGRPVRTHRGK